MKNSIDELKSFLKNPSFNYLLALVILTMLIGTVFYHYVEGFNWIDSVYFSIISLTTVGYGDIIPSTNLGKLFTIFYLVIGIGILLGLINVIAKEALSRTSTTKEIKEKIERKEKSKIKKKLRKKLKGL